MGTINVTQVKQIILGVSRMKVNKIEQTILLALSVMGVC